MVTAGWKCKTELFAENSVLDFMQINFKYDIYYKNTKQKSSAISRRVISSYLINKRD